MNAPPVPESRVYTHQHCTSETVVGEEAFEALSDPLSGMTRTWCNACNDFFPLSEYTWTDTGEKITDYYQRHGARASKVERFLCSRTFLVITAVFGLLLGIVLAVVLFRNDGWMKLILTSFAGGVIGVVLFGSLKEFLLGPLILWRVCGVRDTRLLK